MPQATEGTKMIERSKILFFFLAVLAAGGCGADLAESGFQTTEPNPKLGNPDAGDSALGLDAGRLDDQHDGAASDSSHSPSCWELGPDDDCADYGCETLFAERANSASCFERMPVGCVPAETNCPNTNEFVWWDEECWRTSSLCLPDRWKLSTGERREACQNQFEGLSRCE